MSKLDKLLMSLSLPTIIDRIQLIILAIAKELSQPKKIFNHSVDIFCEANEMGRGQKNTLFKASLPSILCILINTLFRVFSYHWRIRNY
jgi:hypothetical protein